MCPWNVGLHTPSRQALHCYQIFHRIAAHTKQQSRLATRLHTQRAHMSHRVCGSCVATRFQLCSIMHSPAESGWTCLKTALASADLPYGCHCWDSFLLPFSTQVALALLKAHLSGYHSRKRLESFQEGPRAIHAVRMFMLVVPLWHLLTRPSVRDHARQGAVLLMTLQILNATAQE